MTNARSIIEQAVRKIQVLGRGQTLPAEEARSALTELNNMLSAFSTDSTLIFTNVIENFTLTGAQSYTIGTEGDLNTSRPVEIQAATVRIGSTDYPIKPMNVDEFSSIGFKAISGTPEKFYYDNNNPLGRLYLYPVGVSGYVLTLYSVKALTSFTSLDTDIDLPSGGEDLLVYNLAVRLAPDYEKDASPEVKRIARNAITKVAVYNKRNNYPTSRLGVAGGTPGNIMSGWLTR